MDTNQILLIVICVIQQIFAYFLKKIKDHQDALQQETANAFRCLSENTQREPPPPPGKESEVCKEEEDKVRWIS